MDALNQLAFLDKRALLTNPGVNGWESCNLEKQTVPKVPMATSGKGNIRANGIKQDHSMKLIQKKTLS